MNKQYLAFSPSARAVVRRLPPLNALRAFEAAARLESFSRAAAELHVTPAAISQQVKGLEAYLGVALFDRRPRGLRLTAEGQAYLPELTRGFDQLARAGDRLHGADLAGRLTVSIIPSLCHLWLMPRLADFRRRYPQIDLHLIADLRSADFARDRVDVGVRYGLGHYPGLRAVPIMEEEVFPVASPALLSGRYPLRRWSDLARHTLLHDSTATPQELWLIWRHWLQRFRVEGVDPTRGLFFDDSTMLFRACVDGHGVAIGRSALVSEALAAGRLIPLFDVRRPAEYSYWAVAPEARADHPRVRAFLDWIAGQGAAAAPQPASAG